MMLKTTVIATLFSVSISALSILQTPLKNPACQRLEQIHGNDLSWPGTPTYINESLSLWSESTILQPYCVFTPQSAADVATALSICKETQTRFAVRGNGHMTVRGAASIDEGVMISMSQMRDMQLIDNIASLGPGLNWETVYSWLQPLQRTILGGRYAPVGVAGYFLGGGISFFSEKHGWATNSVQNFEIVTADGNIINANSTDNSDLFWALKGGSSNFGIVTRFDVETYPAQDVFAGILEYANTSVEHVFDALKSYVSPGGGIEDPDSAILPNINLFPGTGQTSADITMLSTTENSTLETTFTAVSHISSTVHQREYNDFMFETEWSGNRSFRDSFWATSLKATPQSIDLIHDVIFKAALDDIADVPGAMISLSIQPISTGWLQTAIDKGGDALNLDPNDGAIIAFNLYLTWANEADDSRILGFAQTALSELDIASQTAGLYYPFIYINDSGAGEKPFELYGNGTSLSKLRDIRKKYDPDAVFQYLQPGGFKLGI